MWELPIRLPKGRVQDVRVRVLEKNQYNDVLRTQLEGGGCGSHCSLDRESDPLLEDTTDVPRATRTGLW